MSASVDTGARAERLSEELRDPSAELDGLVGSIVVDVEPSDAKVTVDGRALPLSELHAGVEVNVGEHTVIADEPGYARLVRVVNVASGYVASGFLYASGSITEIDMEQVGNIPDAVDCTNWHGESDFQDTEVTGYDQGNNHDFKIVWQPGYVDWYVDGTQVVHHTQAVPSAPAPFLFNLWGTNSSSFGGTASPGTTRYMYISNFSYHQ